MASDGRIMIEMTADEARFLRACSAAAAGLTGVEGGAKRVNEETRRAHRDRGRAVRDVATYRATRAQPTSRIDEREVTEIVTWLRASP